MKLVCRFCGDAVNAADHDAVSAWSHSHPSRCPYRQDRMPSINGVHVGDHWRNLHTGTVVRVIDLRLGGAGIYTDREPCVVYNDVVVPPPEQGPLFGDEPPPSLEDIAGVDLASLPTGSAWLENAMPLWSLAEHWEPLTRPGEYPMPWETSKRFHGGRSVVDAWRSPGYRHVDDPALDREKAYWHAWHTVRGYGIEWGRTNVLWQIDPDRPDVPVWQPPRPAAVDEQLTLLAA